MDRYPFGKKHKVSFRPEPPFAAQTDKAVPGFSITHPFSLPAFHHPESSIK
jgi:hypothetical protein